MLRRDAQADSISMPSDGVNRGAAEYVFADNFESASGETPTTIMPGCLDSVEWE